MGGKLITGHGKGILQEDSAWGGRREGAGRPTDLAEPVKTQVTLELDQLEWLMLERVRREMRSLSELMRDIVQRYMARSNHGR